MTSIPRTVHGNAGVPQTSSWTDSLGHIVKKTGSNPFVFISHSVKMKSSQIETLPDCTPAWMPTLSPGERTASCVSHRSLMRRCVSKAWSPRCHQQGEQIPSRRNNKLLLPQGLRNLRKSVGLMQVYFSHFFFVNKSTDPCFPAECAHRPGNFKLSSES